MFLKILITQKIYLFSNKYVINYEDITSITIANFQKISQYHKMKLHT